MRIKYFKFGDGIKVNLNKLVDSSFNKNKRIYTTFVNFNKNKPTGILHRFYNCVLSGNLLRDEEGLMKCDGITTRPDCYFGGRNSGRFTLTSDINNKQYNIAIKNKRNIGFLLRTLRDQNYAFFIGSCIQKIWYLKKIIKMSKLQNQKVTLIIGGLEGGWIDKKKRGDKFEAILQSRYINDIKKEFKIEWKDIHQDLKKNTKRGIQIKNKIKNKILEWGEKYNYKNFKFDYDLINEEIVYDLSYIQDIIELLCDDLNVEIVPQDNDLAFNYLFVPAPLSCPFSYNFFPILNPPIEIVFKDLLTTCFNKCNKKLLCCNKNFFYITRNDMMDGVGAIKGRYAIHNATGRIITNQTELNKLLINLEFSLINSSYYKTIEKYELFYNGKIFIIEEGASISNWIFFPKNSIIIIISNGGWYELTHNGKWWLKWNKEHLNFLNHKVIFYDKVTCKKKNNCNIKTTLTNLNDLKKKILTFKKDL